MQSIVAQKQRLIMHEQATANKAADAAARRDSGVAAASLPPRIGVNAREAERKQAARDGGVNIWTDIAGGVTDKLKVAAAAVQGTDGGRSP